MKRFTKNDCVIISLFLTLVLMLGTVVYAALTVPDVVDTVDYFGTEPFKGSDTLRTSVILTNSYVDTDFVDMSDYSKVCLLFDITQGSLTSVEYRVHVSYDNINWFIEATETVAAGLITDVPANYTITLGGDTKYFKILNIYPPYMKLSVKGTGTVTNSLMGVHIVGVM